MQSIEDIATAAKNVWAA